MKRCIFNENYSISKDGRVFSHLVERFLKPSVNTQGYPIVNMQGKIKGVHTLVAEAFIENPRKHKEVNHKDNNPLNADYKNLEWCTHKENMAYSAKQKRMVKPTGQGSWRTKYKVTSFNGDCIVKEYYGAYEAARDNGVTVQAIEFAIKNKSRSKGLRWEKRIIES